MNRRSLPLIGDFAAVGTPVRVTPTVAAKSVGGSGQGRRTMSRHVPVPFEFDPEAGARSPKVPRPQRREDCLAGGENELRPCPFVSCHHHLAIEIGDEDDDIFFAFPNKQPWELVDSCALDVADRGGSTLKEIGETLGVTRERIRQLEALALGRSRHVSRARVLEPFKDAEFGTYAGLGVAGGSSEDEESARPPVVESDDAEEESSRASLYSAGRLPKFGMGEESEGYAEAETTWLLEQFAKRAVERKNGVQMLFGVPLSPRAMEAVDFIKRCWLEKGSGPALLDIADALGIEGSSSESRRSSVNIVLQGLREARVLVFTKGIGAQLVDPAKSLPKPEARPAEAVKTANDADVGAPAARARRAPRQPRSPKPALVAEPPVEEPPAIEEVAMSKEILLNAEDKAVLESTRRAERPRRSPTTWG